jgi:hypothetical protein
MYQNYFKILDILMIFGNYSLNRFENVWGNFDGTAQTGVGLHAHFDSDRQKSPKKILT